MKKKTPCIYSYWIKTANIWGIHFSWRVSATGPNCPGPNCPPPKSGQLGPGAQLSGAQLSTPKKWTVRPRGPTVRGPVCLEPLSIKMYDAEKMCEVTSFCCGCADLRKGALIIGSLNLVKTIIVTIINNIIIIINYNKDIIGSLNLVNVVNNLVFNIL